MLNKLLDDVCSNGAIETLVDLLKKQDLTEQQAYLLLTMACQELMEDNEKIV